MERRHTNIQPRTQLGFAGVHHKRMQPQGLRLEAFRIQVWRSKGELSTAEERANIAALSFNDVTSTTVLFRDERASGDNPVVGFVAHFHRDFILHHADQNHGDGIHFVVLKMEIRHSQQLFGTFYATHVEDARIVKFLLVPRVSRMLNVQEPEIELADHLAAGFAEFGSDGLGIFESGDRVTTETSVTADEALAGEETFLLSRH